MRESPRAQTTAEAYDAKPNAEPDSQEVVVTSSGFSPAEGEATPECVLLFRG